MKIKFALTSYVALAVLTLGLAACGGGGGGGGDSASSLSYTGTTRQATLDSTSTRTVSASLLNNTDGAGAASQTRAVDTSRSVTSIARRLALSAKGVTRNGHTTAGTCGGSVSVSGDNNGGAMSFDNYCEGDPLTAAIRINGTMVFSATYTAGGLPLTFTMSYNGFTVTLLPENETFAFGGSMSVLFDASGFETGFTMTVAMQDNTGTMILFDNYTVSNNGGGTFISGRFCHATQGCVTIATEQALYFSGDYPYQGVIVLTGENGKARITATSATTYALQLDVAPFDGTYEQTLTGQTW